MIADWTDPCLDASQMRDDDRWAIEDRGIPSLELMETAGRALAAKVEQMAPSPDSRIVAVCGKGNNGGDGLVAARILKEQGFRADAVLLGGRDGMTPDSVANLERLGEALEASDGVLAELLSSADLVIDAIFGTGFAGEPRDAAADAIDALNASPARVVSADLPSGVNASTGEIAGRAVAADATVTFHRSKVGHWIAPGKWARGDLEVADIGIPDGAPAVPSTGLISSRVLDLPADRGAASTKFSSGKVVVCGGSKGLTGAVAMCATAAIRAGAGYATVVVPAELESVFEAKLTEVMSIGCPSREGSFRGAAEEQILGSCEQAGAVVFGPGLGREGQVGKLAVKLIPRFGSPLVVDADALYALSGLLGVVASRRSATVLTPHEGELARLLQTDSDDVAAHRLERALGAARETGAVVVLKGDDTIVTDGERVAIDPLSTPALATAGTGDVLAGMIAAMISRGLGPFEAACVAVKAHSSAGIFAAERHGVNSVIASDVIEEIPRGLRR